MIISFATHTRHLLWGPFAAIKQEHRANCSTWFTQTIKIGGSYVCRYLGKPNVRIVAHQGRQTPSICKLMYFTRMQKTTEALGCTSYGRRFGLASAHMGDNQNAAMNGRAQQLSRLLHRTSRLNKGGRRKYEFGLDPQCLPKPRRVGRLNWTLKRLMHNRQYRKYVRRA